MVSFLFSLTWLLEKFKQPPWYTLGFHWTTLFQTTWPNFYDRNLDEISWEISPRMANAWHDQHNSPFHSCDNIHQPYSFHCTRILLNTVLELLTSNRSELVLTSLEAYDLATNRKPNPRETVGSCYRNSGWIWLQAHIDQGFPLSLSSAFFQISSILKFHMGTTGYSRPPSAWHQIPQESVSPKAQTKALGWTLVALLDLTWVTRPSWISHVARGMEFTNYVNLWISKCSELPRKHVAWEW